MTFWFWKQTRKAIIFRYFTSDAFHWFVERSRGRISQPKRNFRCLDAAKVFSGENWSWILFWGLKYQYLNSKKSLQNDPKYCICITEQCWARAKAAVHKVGCPDLNISSNFSEPNVGETSVSWPENKTVTLSRCWRAPLWPSRRGAKVLSDLVGQLRRSTCGQSDLEQRFHFLTQFPNRLSAIQMNWAALISLFLCLFFFLF